MPKELKGVLPTCTSSNSQIDLGMGCGTRRVTNLFQHLLPLSEKKPGEGREPQKREQFLTSRLAKGRFQHAIEGKKNELESKKNYHHHY